MRGPGDDVTKDVVVMVAQETGLWSLLEVLARDSSLTDQMRALAMQLLRDGAA